MERFHEGGVIMKTIRQGDVVFVEVDNIPSEYKKVDGPLKVFGERGRHVHVVDKVEVYKSDDRRSVPLAFIQAFETVDVVHDVMGDPETSHPAQTLEPGIYEVRRARRNDGRWGD
jgi:hypothetical protein